MEFFKQKIFVCMIVMFGILQFFPLVSYAATTPTTAPPTAPTPSVTNSLSGSPISGTITTSSGGIIQCGRAGQNMCTLCDLIAGMNRIIQYLMKIAIGVALLAMAIGGIMYTISAGDTGMIEMGKKAMTNAAIGFVVIFAAFMIINVSIQYLGARTTNGQPTFGFTITSWGQFDCAAKSR